MRLWRSSHGKAPEGTSIDPIDLERLRRPPVAHTVSGSLPVLSFGDLTGASVATVGINPSWAEFADLNRAGNLIERHGAARRFETLASLGALDRAALSDDQCAGALATMRRYFAPGGCAYWSWFGHLERVLAGMGLSYRDGTASHLDIIQEATYPGWSRLLTLSPGEATALWQADLPFLMRQIAGSHVRLVLANGRSVLDVLVRETGAHAIASGKLELVRWWVGRASVNGRAIIVAGWNRPLSRPTALGAAGEHTLGETLLATINPHGSPTA